MGDLGGCRQPGRTRLRHVRLCRADADVTWPKPSDFHAVAFKRRTREKLQRWTKAEAAQMRAERLERECDEWLRKIRTDSERALRSIFDAVSSEEFAAWYESKTGKDAAPVVSGLREAIQLAVRQRDKSSALFVVRQTIARIDAIEVVDREWLRSVWSDELQQATGRQRRRLLLRLATPKWASPAAMVAMYELRDAMTAATGELHHVDHIVPIQHPLVCGLNCEANLRVVTATANMRKSNRFTVG